MLMWKRLNMKFSLLTPSLHFLPLSDELISLLSFIVIIIYLSIASIYSSERIRIPLSAVAARFVLSDFLCEEVFGNRCKSKRPIQSWKLYDETSDLYNWTGRKRSLAVIKKVFDRLELPANNNENDDDSSSDSNKPEKKRMSLQKQNPMKLI